MPLPEGITVKTIRAHFWTVQFTDSFAYVSMIDEEPFCHTCHTSECDHILAVLEHEVPSDGTWELTDNPQEKA